MPKWAKVITGVLILFLAVGALLFLVKMPPADTSSTKQYEAERSGATLLKPAEKPSIPATRDSFSFVAQGGIHVTATVLAKPGDMNKLIVFSLQIDWTDGNLYGASLEIVWNVYGKQHGSFRLEDAQYVNWSDCEGKGLMWNMPGSGSSFYTCPIKDSSSGNLGAMMVKME